MKFASVLLALVSYVAVASAHMALLEPTPRGGYGTKQYNGRVHAFIGFKDSKWNMRFPCGGYAPGPITNLKAGQVVNTRFYASGMRAADIKTQPKAPKGNSRQFSQARHGGGTCEYSLSYDNGKSFHLIGKYTKTCPDAYFRWPVLIPKTAPSCKKAGCLFVWTWTANILPQWYMNCADIRLDGVSGKGQLNKKGIQIVDFAPHKRGVTAPGDGVKHKASTGPNKKEVQDNLNGVYSK